MSTYYKATRPDGTDFRTGTVDYAGGLSSGEPVTHPDPHWGGAYGYLSVSVEPAETLIGGSWPCRLFEVEPVGEARPAGDYPHKRAVFGLRVVREIEAWRALGPQGEHVAAFIERIPGRIHAARDAAEDAARGAARDAARDAAEDAARGAARGAAEDAAWNAVWNAARDAAEGAAWNVARGAAEGAAEGAAWNVARGAAEGAAWNAAGALTVRDLITPDQFAALTLPWKILTGEEL